MRASTSSTAERLKNKSSKTDRTKITDKDVWSLFFMFIYKLEIVFWKKKFARIYALNDQWACEITYL